MKCCSENIKSWIKNWLYPSFILPLPRGGQVGLKICNQSVSFDMVCLEEKEPLGQEEFIPPLNPPVSKAERGGKVGL